MNSKRYGLPELNSQQQSILPLINTGEQLRLNDNFKNKRMITFKTFVLSTLIIVFLYSFSAISQEDHSQEKQEIACTIQKANYSFTIEFKETNSDFPEEIIVKFENKGDGVILHNFILQFFSEENSYRGLNDDFRFGVRPLILLKDSVVCETLRFDSFSYQSMKTNEFVSFEVFKESLLSGNGFKVLGIIGDRSRAQNLFESNLTTRSNMIEYKISK